MNHRLRHRRDQRGTTLVESLVAFALIAIATVGAGHAGKSLRTGVDIARQRTEAVRIAAAEIESLRSFASAASGASSYAAIASSTHDVAGRNVDYRVTRQVDIDRNAKQVSVVVAWLDRAGEAQQVRVDTGVVGIDPGYGAALSLAGIAPHRAAPYRRAATIPPLAVRLGDGRSVWKPAAGAGGPSGAFAIVVDDSTGDAIAHCHGVAVAATAVTAADLATCTGGRWLVLSGTIRFDGALLPASVSLSLTRGRYAATAMCSSDAMKTVRHADAGGGVRFAAVGVDAAPAALGAATWHDTGDRFVAWRCLVPRGDDGRWSGRADVVASGWTIGTTAADLRVCRYQHDRDGSGAIDGNAEHPAEWIGVDQALTAQNFLVVRGDVACGHAGGAVDASLAIASHQP